MMIQTTNFVGFMASIHDLAQIARTYHPPTPKLRQVYTELVEPLLAALASDTSPALICDRAPVGTPLYKQAATIVNYAYSSRYTVSHRWLEFADPSANAEITTIRLDSNPSIVIATQRLAWGSGIDVFELFDVPLDVLSDEGIPGNVGRFALNPVFDAIFARRNTLDPTAIDHIDAFRMELFRQITLYCFWLLAEKDAYDIYTICHADIRTWMSKAGMIFREVANALPKDSDTIRQIKALYPGYWDKAPGVFTMEVGIIS